jgi:ribonuclease HI
MVVGQGFPGGRSPLPLLNHHGRFGGGGSSGGRGSRLSLQPFSSVNILTTERVTAVLEGSPSSLGLRLQSQSSSSSPSQPDTPSSSTANTTTTIPSTSSQASASTETHPENSMVTLENISFLKARELRMELSIRGLESKGKKDVLRTRLESALEQEVEAAAINATEQSLKEERISVDSLSAVSSSSSSSSSSTLRSSGAFRGENLTIQRQPPAVPPPPPRLEHPESLDLDQMYILRVRAHSTLASGGAGIGMVLYSCQEGKDDSTTTTTTNENGRIIPYIKDELWSGRVYLSGNRSMFEADYTALLVGLDFCTTQFKIRRLHLQVDNDILVRQIEGAYRVNRPTLQAMLHCWHHQRQAMLSFSGGGGGAGGAGSLPQMEYLNVSHISYKENATAMAFAQTAMATRKSVNLLEGNYQVTDPFVAAHQWVAKNLSTVALSPSRILKPIPTLTEPQTVTVSSVASSSSSTLVPPTRELKKELPTIHEPTKKMSSMSAIISQEERVDSCKDTSPRLEMFDEDNDDEDDDVGDAEDTAVSKDYASGIIDPSKTYVLQFDGGSRGNPGLAGAGMVIFDSETGDEIWCGWKYHSDNATNNLAEYLGLLCGLKCAKSLGIRHLIVEGDSQLIVRHLKGQYKCREETLKVFFHAAKEIIAHDFDTFDIRHIPRAENSRADFLANHAMDTRESGGFTTSTTTSTNSQ